MIGWLLLCGVISVMVICKIVAKLTIGRCSSNVCLVGKTAIVTGGNSGIGYQTVLNLASRGCRVIIADKANCDKSKDRIVKETNNGNIVTKYLDLSNFESVRKFAKEINDTEDRLDILINNAGAGGLGNEYTADGLHIGMQTNYFGPFLLTCLLVDLLKKSAPSRIVFVSSLLAFTNNLNLNNINYPERGQVTYYSDTMVYGNGKLCTIIISNEIAKKLGKFGVTCNSVHPGMVNTTIYVKAGEAMNAGMFYKMFTKFVFTVFGKNAEEGAQSALHAALDKRVEGKGGQYFVDCRNFPKPPLARDQEFSKQVWEATERFVKLSPSELLSSE